MLLGLHVGETTLGNMANRILSLCKGLSDASDGTIGQGLPGLPLLGGGGKEDGNLGVLLLSLYYEMLVFN